jgi:hypothetical protein
LDSGTYSTFEIPDNFTMVANLANGATVNLTLLIDNSVVKLAIYGGSIAIDIFNTIRDTNTSNYENTLQICAKHPALQLTGRTFMEQAYLSTSPTSVLAFGYPVIISGTTSFQIENVDQAIIRISNFLLNGELSPQKPEKMWEEWNIPWMQVFTSAYGLLFLILAIVVVLLFTRICFPSKKRDAKTETAMHKDTARYPLVPKSVQTYPLMLQSEQTSPLM